MKSLSINKYQAASATLLLASVGAFISLYLWNATVTATGVVCFTGCESVISGEYGKMFGVPVSAYGFAFYGLIILLAYLRMNISDRLLDKLMFSVLVFGVAYTLYLRYLEFFVIGDICIWCWGSALVIVLICIVQYLGYRRDKV